MVAKAVVRISPHCKTKNGSLVPIGHMGRFLLFKNKKNEMENSINRTVN